MRVNTSSTPILWSLTLQEGNVSASMGPDSPGIIISLIHRPAKKPILRPWSSPSISSRLLQLLRAKTPTRSHLSRSVVERDHLTPKCDPWSHSQFRSLSKTARCPKSLRKGRKGAHTTEMSSVGTSSRSIRPTLAPSSGFSRIRS